MKGVIPEFTRDGLLPVGQHEASWMEFVARYEGTPDNGRRRKLMLGLAQVLVLLEQAGCQVAFVDGSFVTRERWPRDFDVCYEKQGMRGADLDPVLLDVSAGRRAQKQRFGGEAMPDDFPIDWSGTTIREAFAYSRETRTSKGLVRLELETMRAEMEHWIEARENALEAREDTA